MCLKIATEIFQVFGLFTCENSTWQWSLVVHLENRRLQDWNAHSSKYNNMPSYLTKWSKHIQDNLLQCMEAKILKK